jgi:hypothetical protein
MRSQTVSAYDFFKGLKTLQEVKDLYKKLARENHPDLGGNIEKMQALNNDYEIACKLIANSQNMTSEEFEKTILDTEAYRNAIDKIIALDGLVIECVGNWVWVTGNTYPHKETLRGAAFMFAGKKKAWYFRSEDFKVKNTNKNYSLEDIKNKYGSVMISSRPSKPQLAA